MAKKEKPLCPVCNRRRAAFPKSDPVYCADDWQLKLERLFEATLDFNFVRLFRSDLAEVYIVLHRANADPVGRVVVLARPGERLVIRLLEENFDWSAPAYELEGDPKVETRSEAMVSAIFSQVLDSWASPDEGADVEIWTFTGRLETETGRVTERPVVWLWR